MKEKIKLIIKEAKETQIKAIHFVQELMFEALLAACM